MRVIDAFKMDKEKFHVSIPVEINQKSSWNDDHI